MLDLEKGELHTTWMPQFTHPNIPPEMKAQITSVILPDALRATAHGALDVPPTWNALLPDLEMTTVEAFLTGVFGQRS
jgi:hypothetical protein